MAGGEKGPGKGNMEELRVRAIDEARERERESRDSGELCISRVR